MADIFQKMGPGIVPIASTDKTFWFMMLQA